MPMLEAIRSVMQIQPDFITWQQIKQLIVLFWFFHEHKKPPPPPTPRPPVVRQCPSGPKTNSEPGPRPRRESESKVLGTFSLLAPILTPTGPEGGPRFVSYQPGPQYPYTPGVPVSPVNPIGPASIAVVE